MSYENLPSKIWWWPYELLPEAHQHLNYSPIYSRRTGALLKIEFANGEIGYSDLHPWPELGTPDLKSYLQELNSKITKEPSRPQEENLYSPQLVQSLYFAALDAKARSKKQFLLDEPFLPKPWPQTHALWTRDLNSLFGEFCQNSVQQGFSHIKIKIRKDSSAKQLNQFCELEGLKVRLDFNSSLSPLELQNFLENCSDELLKLIDFIEDPMPWNHQVWKEFISKHLSPSLKNRLEKNSLTLAMDWNPTQDPFEEKQESFLKPSVWIVKPALQNISKKWSSQRFARVVFTHLMDHPLGQVAALYTAGRFYQNNPQLLEVCGLSFAGVYKKEAFAECLSQQGPRLHVTASGYGWGFDDLLEKLTWKKLNDISLAHIL